MKYITPNLDINKLKLDLSKTTITQQGLVELSQAIKDNQSVGHIKWGELPKNSEQIISKIEDKLFLNNKNHSSNPNDFIHILLSLHSYENISKNATNLEFHDSDNKKYNKYLKNWKISEIFDDYDSSYYGVIYINDLTKQMVLAHRGTKIEGETKFQQLLNLFVRRDSDIQTDIEGVFSRKIVTQQIKAYEAISKAVDFAKENNYNLSTTGHSLGAWLSEMSGYYCHKDLGYPSIKIVNFDSPGSAIHFENFDSKIKNYNTDFDPKIMNIVTYLSSPNIINCCNKHIGKVYRLFPEILDIKQIERSFKWIYNIPYVGHKLKNNKFLLDGILSLSGHSLKGLVNSFDPSTMKPRKYMEVLDWPVINFQKKISITDSLMEKLLPYVPDIFFSFILERVIDKIITKYSSRNAVFGAINIISHFLCGNIDLEEYFEVYKQINTNSHDQDSGIIEHSPYFKRFSLIYKANYRVVEVDPYLSPLNTLNKGSMDWYLNKLMKYSDKKIQNNFSNDISKKLLSFKRGYIVQMNLGKKYIFSKNKDYTVEQIRNYMNRMLLIEESLKSSLI